MIDISLIIPTYNRTSCLKRALESVSRQTYEPAEIIVVDDGSTDDTAKMIKKDYPDIIYIQQENSGVSAARNLGIQNANHEWIALLDSDDEWLPEKLALQTSVIENDPDESHLVHSNEFWIRNGTRVNQMDKHEKYGGWIFEHCLPMCAISPSSVLIKKSLLYEAGLFDELLPACEDYDMWLKICARHPVKYLPQPLIKKYGGHDDQLSRKYWGMDRFRIKALVNLHASNFLTNEQTSLVVTQLQKKISIYLNGAIKRGKNDDIEYYSSLQATYTNGKVCPGQLVQ
ncbi:MAG: glycosyltransferase family 2 protein [Acidiferrobacterales bacterium]